MNSYKTILLVSYFAFFSCSNSKLDIKISEKTVNKLSSISDGIPSIYSNSPIYVLLINNQIAETNNSNMFIVFERNYKKKYNSFKDFLRDALLQKISFIPKEIKINPYIDSFSINKNIEYKYKSLDFEDFKKIYCYNNYNLLCLNREKLNPDELQSVLFFFFISNYQIEYDDILGKICFKEW